MIPTHYLVTNNTQHSIEVPAINRQELGPRQQRKIHRTVLLLSRAMKVPGLSVVPISEDRGQAQSTSVESELSSVTNAATSAESPAAEAAPTLRRGRRRRLASESE